jgi:hypothetical protein
LGLNAIRIGHPARVLESLQEHTLDYLVDADPAMKVVREMRREADLLATKAGRWTRAKPMAGAREGGASGFFSGLGKRLFGAYVTSSDGC